MRLGELETEGAAPGSAEPPARPAVRRWSAIVLAGTRAERDPLSEHFGTPMKALVPVGGEPMLGRVVRTLLEMEEIGTILILAQQPALLVEELPWLEEEGRISVARSSGRISETLLRSVGSPAAPWPVLVTTGDHPLLTGEMVRHFLAGAAEKDFAVAVVERSILTRRYPATRRTWLRFKGGAYTGANMFAVQSAGGARVFEVFGAAEAHRKQQLKLLWHFGPLVALATVAGLVSMHGAIARGARRFEVSAAAVELPFADAGVDVDRLEDQRLADRILAARGSRAAPQAQPVPVSVFDLDRTVTRRGTYTAFLVHAAARHAPWRLLLAPLALLLFALHGCGLFSRKRLKELLQRLFLGGRIGRGAVARLAEQFAAQLRRRGFHAAAVRRLDRERREGRRIVLATAANGFYVDAIARELAVDDVVCTGSVWDGDHLVAQIAGANCYGDEKLHMLARHFTGLGLRRPDLHVRFFSDHSSDLAMFRWADEAFVVNPKRKFREFAARAGWPVLNWA